MPIKAKYNGSYKDITDLMNVDESIDYVLAKTSSSYKRVYTATRSMEGIPPTTFKSIKPGANLTDYRIYGQTSRNLFDMKTFAETCNQVYGTVNYINNTLTFTATNGVDAYVNSVYNKGAPFYVGERPSCIDVLPSTTYTISMSSAPKCYISWVNSSYEVVSAYTQIPANQKSYTFTTPSNCTKLLIRLGKEVTNIGDTFTISDIMLNSGSTPLPYEPYGESVGDRTGNLCENSISGVNISSNGFIYADIYNDVGYAKVVAGETYTINSYVYAFFEEEPKERDRSYDNGRVVGTSPTTFEAPINGYVAFRTESGSQLQCNEGNNLLPYEPYGYKVPVTVEGKNLYKISTFRDGSTSAVVSAVTFTINNNAVSISGISSAQHPSVTSQRFELISGETYSAKIFVDGSYDGEMYIIMRGGERQDGSDEVKYKRINVGSGDTFVAKTYNSIIYVAEGTNKEFNAIVRVILIKGSMLPDTYEPYHTPITTPIYLPEQIKMVGDEAEYIDYGVQKQHRVRKNLLPNNAVSRTMNGITVTVNEDGSIVCDGTATSTTEIRINLGFLLSAGNYRLTGCPSGGGGTSYYLRAWYSSEPVVWLNDNGEGFNFTLTDTTTMRSSIVINNSQVVEHLTFYPMIRKADIEDDTYEPYIENTDLDVTLPALPTLPGTNVLSVGTEVQPSKIDITGHIKTISGGS